MSNSSTTLNVLSMRRAPRNEREAFSTIADERMHRAIAEAHATGRDKGYQLGYVAGARAGRLAGFCWGFLLGSAAVGLALKLGWMTGRLA